MVDRGDLGSWLSGPDTSGISKYPGERLGLPESGPRSVARAGRRILALLIDWGISMLICHFLFADNPMGNLGIFALMQVLLVGTAGFSIGHRIAGIHVVRIDGRPVGVLAALIRTVLICLIIPVVITDPDHRGVHDRAINTILIRL